MIRSSLTGRAVRVLRALALRALPLLALLLLTRATLGAQETPAERAAAAEVVRKMGALQQSLGVPALVSQLTAANPVRDAIAARAKQLMDTELLAMADDITRHPEIGFTETRSVLTLTEYLKRHGFDITMGVGGLSTAFVAKYHNGTPGPNLGIIVEYDALRGTKGNFHGDQHSAQGPTGMAAGIAVAEFLTRTKTPGTVTIYGTPAEEMMPPPAKTVMHEAHVFDGADIIVRSHSSTASQRAASGFGSCCLNIDGVKYTFSGAPAHQMTPWEGRDALTAVIHLFNNVDAMRRNMRPETRIQGIITEGGKAPNVVPDLAVADFYIRYPDQVYLAQVREMVDNAARAAALAASYRRDVIDGPQRPDQTPLEALAAWIASESRGLPIRLPQTHAEERRFYELGKRAFFYRAGPMDFACATCHSNDGKRIRLQDLPNLTQNPGDGVGFAAWPAYRVSNGQMWGMQLRLNDCYRQQRFPYALFGSEASMALSVFMGVTALGVPAAAPAIRR